MDRNYTSIRFSIGVSLTDAGKLADAIRQDAGESANEEDLRVKVEGRLRPYFQSLDIRYDAHYDQIVAGKKKPDALFGKVVTSYKKPRLLESKTQYDKAISDLHDDLRTKADSDGRPLEEYVGILLDGTTLGYTKFRAGDWYSSPPLKVDQTSTRLMLSFYHALATKPLSPEGLTNVLGPRSEVFAGLTHALWHRLGSPQGRVKLFYTEWRRLFGQVSGYEAKQLPELSEIAFRVKIPYDGDVPRLLFTIHSYFALVIKLLAAELLVIHRDGQIRSYWEQLAQMRSEDFRKGFEEMENGGVFRQLGIENFLEGDFFSWYLDMWDEELQRCLGKLVHRFREFEPRTGDLEPDRVRDLLKRLYQYLAPKKLRHDLGEFYTPDWLAEFVLDSVGYDGKLGSRLIDPACGSGTFLVLAIKRVRSKYVAADIEPVAVLSKILENIVGFDLNPLAVLAARTNYLVALGELLNYLHLADLPISIPVYLADSIAVPQKTGSVYSHRLLTEMGEIKLDLPTEIVETGLVGRLMAIMEEAIKSGCDEDEAIELIERQIGSQLPIERFENALRRLFRPLKNLEEKDWDKVWCRVVKNRYAPSWVGEFDFVVGNPSWVRWTMLPASYKDAVKDYCQHYGLFSKDAWVGGIESDISMVLVYSAIDHWCASEGRIGFVITQTVFKSESAEGFRRFILPDGIPFQVTEVHDMVELKPFEGANNRTAAFFAVKGKPTSYPVPYIKWRKS